MTCWRAGRANGADPPDPRSRTLLSIPLTAYGPLPEGLLEGRTMLDIGIRVQVSERTF
ncbi:hypothetical protein BQ8420_05545 [Nocardiopsis sp. JB363]|nr:hypothetical protein BQ8420_05545 [Nocardiopsis sp. JB363]